MTKRLFSILFVLGLGLALVSVALLGAQTSRAATQPPNPIIQVDSPANPLPSAPDWSGTWEFGPSSTFQFTRFDGEYYPGDGMVYFLGGRLADNNTDGSVWMFDPLTGVYADTGVDLPTPISNYEIQLLQDSNGWGLYIFCGRPAAGGVIDFVQVYYPDTNTVAQLPAGDDFPGTGTCSSGLQITYNNKVYTAGGFDAVSNFSETWIFDPMAASGSRWTQLASATLGTARAYIMGAVVDDLIYAIGGSYLSGTSLVNVQTVEVLDPNAGTPVWDDASALDLPEPCSESRAWGFDSDSNYIDPDGTPLAGKIVVGCGFWSIPINHVLVYDTLFNFWEDYPYLQSARRSEAAAFLPISGTITENVGSLWVWGGYDDQTPQGVLVSSEYYAVISGSLPLPPTFDLIPPYQASGASVGDTVNYTMTVLNELDHDETFSITYSSAWPVSGPVVVGPIADGASVDFVVSVEVPSSANCYISDLATLTALAQTDLVTDTAEIETSVAPDGTGGVDGTVIDANTGLGIPNAYVFLQLGDEYYDTYSGGDGTYGFADIPSGCSYETVSSAQGYQFNYPSGYTTTVQASITTTTDMTMTAPLMSWSQDSFSATLTPGERYTFTLWITNSGTADLSFGLDSASPSALAPVGNLALPFGDTKVDPKLSEAISDSPNGRADILVIMAEQADLSAAYTMQDWNARGQYVFNTLQETADRTQARVRELLTSRQVDFRIFNALNGILIHNGDTALLDLLATHTEIGYLTVNGSVQLETPHFALQSYGPPAEASTIEWGVDRVNADDVWSTYSITGTGIVVANIDTGVDWTHDALVTQYRGGPGSHDYNWYMPTIVPECGDGSEPCDNDGHGTHTMGTMVGDDGGTNQVGVAPGAQWIACKGCEYNSCSFEALLACGDWMVAPTDTTGNNPDPDMRPNVINNSWGGGGGDFWYAPVVSAWRASGMFPQFSGGNAGPNCSTTGSPGDYWLNFAAAAVAQGDIIAGFSARGPADVTGLIKPNISGPGVNIRSSFPGNTYGTISGTSMASPHVAGVVALLWSADPELIGDIEGTMQILSQTADPLFLPSDPCDGSSHPNNVFGWGMVDALAAVNAALVGDQTVPWLELIPNGGIVPPGDSIAIQVVFQAPEEADIYTGTLKLTANEPYNSNVQMPLTLTVEGANFIAAPTSGIAPLFVQFTDISIGNFDSWWWDFGNGITSTLQNPTYTYTVSGGYTVTLTVNGPGGSATLSRENYITVYQPVVADFTADVTSGVAPLLVQFTDLSTGDFDTWLWDFGDGITSTLQSPSHTYLLNGVYTVTLTVSGLGGIDTKIQIAYITVIEPPPSTYEIYLPLVSKSE